MDNKWRKGSITFLLKELHNYRWYSTLLPIMKCCTEVTKSLILILLPKDVLNYIQNGRSFHQLIERILLLGILLLLVSVINLVLQTEITQVSETFIYRRLNDRWERKAMRMTYDSFISSKGKITMERARNVSCSVNWGLVLLLGRITALLEAIVGLVVFSIIVCKLNIIMLVLLIVLFLAELVVGLLTEKKKQIYKEENAKVNRKINYIAYGTNGIREAKDIRIYSMVPLLKKITRQVIHKKDQVEGDVHKFQFIHLSVTAATILTRDSISYIYLIYLYKENTMAIGDFSMYFAAIASVGVWLTKLAKVIADFKETSNAAKDFQNYMELPETDNNKEQNKQEKNDKEQLDVIAPIAFTFRHVSYSYRIYDEERGEICIPIIKDMNLTVKPGEKIAIVGVNGAGKSTLIKLLSGMLTPDEGEILVQGSNMEQGINIRNMNKQQYYSLFSAVFQQSRLLPMSIADNIILNLKGKKDKKSIERLWKVIDQVGLRMKISELPKGVDTCLVKRIAEHGIELSGGQKQRLLLARALYKDAPVLLLDEPTAALDPISEHEIYQKYNELTKGKTSFFVSHRLASTRFCDRILYMEEGRIVEEGTHAELMGLHGKYEDMFKVQSKYYKEDAEEMI